MTEHIGYMQELGIEYGYGMTSSLEWLLEHIHVYSGMPWWGTIITTAFLSRLFILPFFLKSSDMTGRMGAIQHLIKPKMTEMQEAASSGDNQKAIALRGEIASMFRRAGVQFKWLFIPMALQAYTAFCALRLMRASANLPVPGFVDGGALWFHDLSICDPYLALPAIMAVTMHVVFRYGGESGEAAWSTAPAMKPFILYVMPVAIFLSMAWFPAGVNLWLSTTGAFGVAQARLLQNAAVRDAIGMAPMIKPTPAPKIEDSIKQTPRRVPHSMQYQAPKPTHIGDIPVSRPRASGVLGRLTDRINSAADRLRGTETYKNAEEARDKWFKERNKSKDPRGAEFERRAEQYERESREARRQRRN